VKGVWGAVWGLLVEDGSLAVGIVAALAVTWILATVVSDGTRDEVGWLLLGLLVILVMFNVQAAGRRARRLAG
jgi:hypothetical protein